MLSPNHFQSQLDYFYNTHDHSIISEYISHMQAVDMFFLLLDVFDRKEEERKEREILN